MCDEKADMVCMGWDGTILAFGAVSATMLVAIAAGVVSAIAFASGVLSALALVSIASSIYNGELNNER